MVERIVYGILLILLSLLAVPSLFAAKSPKAKELLDKIAPFQGWIGILFCIWGIWGIVSSILSIGLIAYVPINWIVRLAVNVMATVLGFILGFGLISKFVLSSNEEAKKKGDDILAKLTPLQGTLGIVGIVVGIASIVFTFIPI